MFFISQTNFCLNLHSLCTNRSITLPKLSIVQKMFNLTSITARLRGLVAPTLALKIQVALGHIHIYLFPISTLKLFSAMKAFLRITDKLKKQLVIIALADRVDLSTEQNIWRQGT